MSTPSAAVLCTRLGVQMTCVELKWDQSALDKQKLFNYCISVCDGEENFVMYGLSVNCFVP